MADAYWRYSESARHPAAVPPPAAAPLKRPRPDYPDMPAGPEMHGYYGDDGRGAGQHAIRDTDSINASYDRFLRNGNPYGPGDNVRPLGGMSGRPVEDLRMLGAGDGWNVGVGGGRPELLPPDASNTVFVEGLPANCTRREVSPNVMDTRKNDDAEFTYGSGHINPIRAVDPGLVFDLSEQDYVQFLCSQGYNASKLCLVTGDNISCSPFLPGSVWDLKYTGGIFYEF